MTAPDKTQRKVVVEKLLAAMPFDALRIGKNVFFTLLRDSPHGLAQAVFGPG